jgi:hypothetical protein
MLKRVYLEGKEKRSGGDFSLLYCGRLGLGKRLHHSTSDQIATVPPGAKFSSSGRPRRSRNSDDGT